MWLTLFVRRVVVVCCILLLLLVGCVPEREAVAPATRRAAEATAVTSPMTATATATAALATATAAAPTAVTPAPTLAPTPALIPSVTGDPLVLSPENAAAITQIAQFGTGTIHAISWSADGATFAVAGPAGIYLYDAATLQELGAYYTGGYGLIDARLSPQGDILALQRCSQDCSVELWQTTSGRLIRNVHQLPTFTPDGQSIIFVQSVDSETSLVWQDVHTGATQRTVQLELLQTSWHTLSPGGEMLAEIASPHTTVRLWDTASGQVRHTIEAPALVNSVAFSPQGDLLVVSSQKNVVHLWDVPSGQPLHVLEGHTGLVGNIVFSPDGRILAIGSADNRTVQLWDTATGRLRHLLTNNNGESMTFPGQSVAFSPDGRQLAVVGGRTTGLGGSEVLFYDTETGQLLRTLAGYNDTMGVAFTPDGHSLIAAGGDEAQTWDVHSGQLRQTQASDIPISSIALSPDGSLMAWGGGKYGYGVDDSQYLVQMWDGVTGQPLYTLQEPGGVVSKVLFSPDGQLLATYRYDVNGLVKLRQASSGELLFSQHASNIVFHPHDRLFAIDTGDFNEDEVSLQFWDLDTFTLVRTLPGLRFPVTFSADGHIVASDDTGTTGLWDIDTGDLLLPFSPRNMVVGYGDPRDAALSPDGRILALGRQLWDMSTGQLLWEMVSGGGVTSVAFSPDGRLLATVNGDGTLSLWGLPPNTAGAEGEAPAAGDSAVPAEVTPCTDDFEFVLDVTVPDGTHFAPGTAFTKTWRLRNSGTCSWDASYRFDFISGEQMNGPESMTIGETVLSGAEVDIAIDLIAPSNDGTYRGQWQLVAPDGTAFGVKPYVEIVVP